MVCLLCLNAVAYAKFSLAVKPSGAINFGNNLDPDATPYLFNKFATFQVTNKNPGAVAEWFLTVAGQGNFASLADPSRSIALGQLEWKRSDTATYAPMTLSSARVASGTAIGVFSYDIDFRFNLTWNDPAARDYRGTLEVTLTDTP